MVRTETLKIERDNKTIITATRTYGREIIPAHEEEIWLDEPLKVNRPEEEKFVSEFEIVVNLEGKDYKDGSLVDIKAGKGIMFNANIDGKYRPVLVRLNDEQYNLLEQLSQARLTEDLSDYDMSTINEVKSAIKNKQVMPAAQLHREIKRFDDINNEGCSDNYNPYRNYLTQEYCDKIISKFKEHFE